MVTEFRQIHDRIESMDYIRNLFFHYVLMFSRVLLRAGSLLTKDII
jgi:hypothetical protein